jgi:phosphoglycerol transferase MdoB-like AlkP superfamily enzyme
MAQEVEHDPAVPQAAEAIHMPEPSYLPFALALGITIALVGVLTGIAVSVIGLIIALTVIVRWIRSARAEMADLPLDHAAH